MFEKILLAGIEEKYQRWSSLKLFDTLNLGKRKAIGGGGKRVLERNLPPRALSMNHVAHVLISAVRKMS